MARTEAAASQGSQPRPTSFSPRFHHHVAFTPAPLLDGEPVLMRAVHSSACPQGTSHHRPITPGARAAAPTTSPHSFPSLPTSSFFLSIKELRGFLRPPTEQKKEFLRVLEVCSIFKGSYISSWILLKLTFISNIYRTANHSPGQVFVT